MGYFHKPLTQYSPQDRCETDVKHTSATVKFCGRDLEFFLNILLMYLLFFYVCSCVCASLCAESTTLVS